MKPYVRYTLAGCYVFAVLAFFVYAAMELLDGLEYRRQYKVNYIATYHMCLQDEPEHVCDWRFPHVRSFRRDVE